ncbi:MAG: hypothetical protein ACO1Q7_08105 [Gemmatimonas sp.]
MNDQVVRWALRSVAVAIAIAAAIDPSITSERSARPDISVLAAHGHADSVAAERVSERLSKSFTVLRAPFAGAVATVVVGTNPDIVPADGGSLFGVLPETRAGTVDIRGIDVPATAAVDARVGVTVMIDASGARGKPVQVMLSSNGAVVDRVTRSVAADSNTLRVPLSLVPTAPGIVRLRVSAVIDGARDTSSADATLSIREQKWAVLFFDPRPSWMSTFVRRAVERDPRFTVTSRIVTAINISTDAGKPPATVDDPAVSELYDAIVVGAPESLSERDAQGLDRFLRGRGGSVVLLFDGNKSGRYQRLAEFSGFTNTANSDPVVLSEFSADTALRATEWMWPTRLPEGADVIAWSGAAASPTRRPIVYGMPAGAGRVLVSGALDAWKFRDSKQSGFERFWQEVLASAAASAPPAVSIETSTGPVAPGEDVGIRVTSRAAALRERRDDQAVRSELAMTLVSDSGRTSVPMWPTGVPGEFVGTVHAPATVGLYTLSALADGATASAPLVVAHDVRVANPDARSVLSAVTAARGGAIVEEANLKALPEMVANAVSPASRRVPWHPMRSPWWLLPFVGALALEWLLRRRRGLP